MRFLLWLGVIGAAFYGGYLLGQREERTLCRRTLQHRMVLTRESAEQLLEAEERLWSAY